MTNFYPDKQKNSRKTGFGQVTNGHLLSKNCPTVVTKPVSTKQVSSGDVTKAVFNKQMPFGDVTRVVSSKQVRFGDITNAVSGKQMPVGDLGLAVFCEANVSSKSVVLTATVYFPTYISLIIVPAKKVKPDIQ